MELEGGLNAVVAETLAFSLNVDAGLEQERGVGVPEAVKCD